MTDRIVVLARGLGTRMRKSDADASLSSEQAKVADSGVKALIPIDRPFLDYVLSVAADAGYRRVCLVIGPEHHELRTYYGGLNGTRLSFEFVVQVEPLGTANAVLAAEAWAAGEPFAMINSDNFYPAVALAGLRELTARGAKSGVALFDRDAMLRGSNIPADRVEKFAIAEIDPTPGGFKLARVIEKPSADAIRHAADRAGGKVYLSMNLWLLGPSIFDACRAIPKSARGEYEITDAVQHAIDALGATFHAVLSDAAVLDLSSRADVGPVAARLRGTKVSL